MPNPTLHSDLLKDDGAIDAAIAKFEKLEKESVAALKSIAEQASKMEAELGKVNNTTGQGRRKTSEAASETAKLEKAYASYQATLTDTNKKIIQLREATAAQNRIQKLEARLARASAGSYDELSARYSLIKIRLNEMSDAQRSATKTGRDLEAEAKRIRDRMNELQQATGNNALNVGNYTESIKGALGEMNRLPGAAGAAAGGVEDLGDQFKILLRNPIVLFLAAIVSGLALLGKGFLRTERGARFMERGNAAVEASLSVLAKVSDKVAEGLEDLFADGILNGLKSIGTTIARNILNRLTAFLPLIESVAEGFLGLRSAVVGDFEAIEKASEKARAAVVQMLTGFDQGEQVQIIKLGKQIAAETEDLTDKFDALAQSVRRRREANLALTRSLGELRKAEEAASLAANDNTRSAKEQLAALDELEQAQRRRLQAEIQIARNNLANITEELRIRRGAKEEVLGLLEAQTDALATLQDKENEYSLSVLEGEKVRREIRRDAFERNLDFAIDFYDAQKTQFEKQIADETRSLEERRGILLRLQELDKSAFEEQQKLIEDFSGQRIKLNELALIDDERVVRARLEQYRLDDVTLGRILETLRERKAATEDIAEAERLLIKQRNEALNLDSDGLEILGFDFGAAAQKKAADRIAKGAAEASREARVRFREELDKTPPVGSVYDLLGIRVGSDFRDSLTTAFDFAKEQLSEWAAFRSRIAEQNVQASEREVEQAQRALDIELENRAQGEANRVESARRELQEAKKQQAEALAERRRAQRAEQRIQTAQQTVNLITATSKIWATLGFPLALPALAVLWGSFISAKVRAASLTKKQFRKGGYMDLDFGGSHESGNDIPFGVSRNGKQLLTAERGEGMAVFTAKARRTYGDMLPKVVEAINRGEYEMKFSAASGNGVRDVQVVPVATGGADMRTAEGYLARIAENSERNEQFDGKGRRVVRYKNETTIYR